MNKIKISKFVNPPKIDDFYNYVNEFDHVTALYAMENMRQNSLTIEGDKIENLYIFEYHENIIHFLTNIEQNCINFSIKYEDRATFISKFDILRIYQDKGIMIYKDNTV